MNKLISAFKGFIIGALNIIPGISSGTLMVVLNIYDRFLDAAELFFKQPVKAILSILDIIIGFLIGIVCSFLLISHIYNSFPLAITLLILGLVFGGYKSIYEKIKGKEKPKYILVLAISAIIVAFLPFITEIKGIFNGPLYYVILVILGLIVAFASIAPGISGSLLLLILGYYYHVLEIGKTAFSLIIRGHFLDSLEYLIPLVILGISIFIGLIISFKTIKKIIDNYETGFYFSVMGMLIGSPVAIIVFLNKEYPINSFGTLEWIIGGLLLISSVLLMLFLTKIEMKKETEEIEVLKK